MKKILAVLAAMLSLLSMSPKLCAQEAQTHPVLVANRSGSVSLVYHHLKNFRTSQISSQELESVSSKSHQYPSGIRRLRLTSH